VGPEDKVRVQPIEVADTVDGKAVIAKGLSAGDRVVTDGQYRLTPGARIVEKMPGKAEVAAAGGEKS
jgi:multidrug efflux system membrane fusion protein